MKATALAFSLLVTAAHAQTTLIEPNNGASWIVPVAGGKTLYGASNPSGNYAFSQWDNLQDLSDFANGQATSANETDTIWTDASGNAWADILSNGAGLPCNPAAGAELDAFWSSIGSVYPNYPPAVLATANLGSISHLYATVTVDPVGFSVQDTRCSVTQAGVLLSLVFNNPTAHQTLFWQMKLRRYPKLAGTKWFNSTGPAYGYTDSIATFYPSYTTGVPLATVTTISIDVLPRIAAIISTATNGIDTNLADWNTGGAYVGINLWGDMTAEAALSGLSLVAQ